MKRGARGVKFDIDSPMQKTQNKPLLIEIFTHEVGHSVFGLDHPKSINPDTIMHPGRLEKDIGKNYMPTTKKDDIKFIAKCLVKDKDDPHKEM